MNTIHTGCFFDALAGDITMVVLGAGGDVDCRIPARFRKLITLVEVDAADKSRTNTGYHAKYTVAKVIAGTSGPRCFHQRAFVGTSSLLEPRQELVRCYGLERYFEPVKDHMVNCTTLPSVLSDVGLDHLDCLATDLEGLDFEVICGCASLLDTMLALRCELRFQPMYVGEPHFHVVAEFLYSKGFELIGLEPQYWKPKTPNAARHTDGRVVYADCIFMRRTETMAAIPAEQQCIAWAKLIIIASMLDRRGYAAYLLESARTILPRAWYNELSLLVRPRFRLDRTALWPLLVALRRFLRKHERFDYAHITDC